jgi:predicted dinucleotide-binding enzyme
MKIAVLGTGMVGQALAGRLSDLGHQVTVGTRDTAATLARTEPDAMGAPPFATWHAAHPDVTLDTFAEAARDAELLVLAGNGAAAQAMLEAAGAGHPDGHLDGVVVLDISNPLDFSAGFPPTLFVKDTDSLAEQLQRAFPRVRVVKSLNTMNASLMVDPASLGSSSTVFVSGDDPEAKAVVTSLLESFGHDDVLDLGGLETARGTEMVLPVWLRLMNALGTPQFNLKVVR